jgi:hypothetical protein
MKFSNMFEGDNQEEIQPKPKRKPQLRGAALRNKLKAEQSKKIREQQLQAIEDLSQHEYTRITPNEEDREKYYSTHKLDPYGAPIPSIAKVDDAAEEAFDIDEETRQEILNRNYKENTDQVGVQKYPWTAIEKAFVEGMPDETGAWHYPTIFDLRTMFGVSYIQARRHIAQGGWVKKRDEWRQALQNKIKEQSMVDLIAAANRFDDSCIEIAQRGIAEILEHFYVAKAEGETMSARELDTLGRAAISLQKVGRLALGLPTENTESKVEMRNVDPFSSLDLSNLTDEQISQLKILLQQSEKNTVDSTVER